MDWLISSYVTEDGISIRPFELQAGYLLSNTVSHLLVPKMPEQFAFSQTMKIRLYYSPALFHIYFFIWIAWN